MINFKNPPSLNEILEIFPSIKAFAWDMDGTLLNTEPLHTLALTRLGAKWKVAPPSQGEKSHEYFVGKADHFIFEVVKNWKNFPALSLEEFVNTKNNEILDLLTSIDMNQLIHPQLLKLISNKTILQVLVTSSEKIIVHKILNLLNIKDHFKFILTREDTSLNKPHPDPYLKSFKLLGIQATDVLIFEDSIPGHLAGIQSGANVANAQWY